MEILNNIWLALSTPNEGLINVIAVPAGFIESFILMLLFIAILNIPSSLKQKLIYSCIMTLSGMISLYLIPDAFNIVFNYFMMIIIFYCTFKNSLFKSTVAVIFGGIIYNIEGALLLNPYLTLFNITGEQLATIPIYRISYIIFVYIILYLLVLIIKHSNLKINFLEQLDKNTKYMVIANLILGIITIAMQTIISVYFTDKLPISITFLSFVSLFAYFALSIYSLTKAFKLTMATQKLESAEEYNNTLRILHDNVRGFKHDFDNIVTTIGGYIKTEDMEGLKNYYSQLEDDCQRVNNLYILNPDVINNDGIYNLLTKKYNDAESKNIKINMTFLLDLSNLNMKIYEFARILGILLDNAIEASSESNEKIINITFSDDYKNSRQLIKIENTYNDPNLDMKKIFEKGISGKEHHTGLGLWEVRKLVKKNNNVNLHTSTNGNYFSQQLEIYYKK